MKKSMTQATKKALKSRKEIDKQTQRAGETSQTLFNTLVAHQVSPHDVPANYGAASDLLQTIQATNRAKNAEFAASPEGVAILEEQKSTALAKVAAKREARIAARDTGSITPKLTTALNQVIAAALRKGVLDKAPKVSKKYAPANALYKSLTVKLALAKSPVVAAI